MIDTTLTQITQAANDADLLHRTISAAAEAGIPNAQMWVDMNLRRIVATALNEDGATIASVLAYAVATYVPTPRPGENPSAVTDTQIREAVQAVRAAQAQ